MSPCLKLLHKMNGNQPLDSLRYLVYDWASKSASVKTSKQKNQCSAARQNAWQHNKQEEEANKHWAEKGRTQ